MSQFASNFSKSRFTGYVSQEGFTALWTYRCNLITILLCLFLASSHVVESNKTPPYRALGCYRDQYPHAVPVYLGSMRSKIKWTNMKTTVDACARLVKHRNPTYKVFGVKFYGECWSGPYALQTYDRYGSVSSTKDCYSGVGTHYTYYVYEFL